MSSIHVTPPPTYHERRRAFTLIELLIVVAIIAILAAVAVPNFLEAQVRSKVSRVKADMRALATGLEAYRIDHNKYPEGTDNPAKYDQRIGDFLGVLAPGFYAIRTRDANPTVIAGRSFHTLTTPIAYATEFFTDPFVREAADFLTFCYRPEKAEGRGYILTSFGPDADIFDQLQTRPGVGTENPNPLSTFSDPKTPARLGDINERAVIHVIEGNFDKLPSPDALAPYGGLRGALGDLSYDPTNGSVSDGDIHRLGPN